MQIKERYIQGLRGYQIDNFYSHPEFILNHIISTPPHIHGSAELPGSKNGREYSDMRHKKPLPELKYYEDIIIDLIGVPVVPAWADECPGRSPLETNFMQWRDTPYNDFYNNYWWPHYDRGWTTIIYLNHETTNGTNIYEDIDNYFQDVQVPNYTELLNPWQPKKHYKLVDYLEPAFNRAYIFQSGKLMHSAAVDDKTYFEQGGLYRLNQVMFFDEVEKDG